MATLKLQSRTTTLRLRPTQPTLKLRVARGVKGDRGDIGPPGGVSSVNGEAGEVTLDAGDIYYRHAGTGGQLRTIGSRLDDIYSVKDFGAAGDGTTDDTDAINATETAANAAGGGLVLFPAGTFIVTGLIKRSNTRWLGAGIGSTIIKLDASTTADAVIAGLNAYSLFGGSSFSGIHDCSISDLTVDGNKANGSDSDGIGIYGFAFRTDNVEVQNCTGWGIRYEFPTAVDDSLSGVHSDNASGWMRDCLIHDNDDGGIDWKGPQDSVLTGVYSYRNLNTNIWIRGIAGGTKLIACHCWGSSVATRQALTGVLLDTTYNSLIGCTVEGSTGQQVWIRSHSNSIYGGKLFYANASPNSVYGVRIGDAANTLPSSQNNIFTEIVDCQAGAIYFDSDQGVNNISVNGFNQSASSVGYAGTPGANSHTSLRISGTSVSPAFLLSLTDVLAGSYGGTGNAFFQVAGPASSLKTYTFPNSSDTVVTLAAAQTLTNKTATGLLGSAASSFTATTQTARDNSTKLATTAYVDAAVRAKLTSARTYYVSTSGSDSNDGLAVGTPFATLNKARDVIATIDLNGFDVTIQHAGSQTPSGALNFNKPVLGGNIILDLGGSTLGVTSANAVNMNAPGQLTVQNGKITTATSGNCVQANVPGAKLIIGASIEFGSCAGAHIWSTDNGLITCGAAYTVSGGAQYHMLAQLGGLIEMFLNTITLSGTPAWSVAGINFDTLSVVSLFSVTFSGSATGLRYQGKLNAVLNSFGAGTTSTYFPGNSNGTTATGAQQV